MNFKNTEEQIARWLEQMRYHEGFVEKTILIANQEKKKLTAGLLIIKNLNIMGIFFQKTL